MMIIDLPKNVKCSSEVTNGTSLFDLIAVEAKAMTTVTVHVYLVHLADEAKFAKVIVGDSRENYYHHYCCK